MQGLKIQVRKMEFRKMTWIFNSGVSSHWNRLSVLNFSALQINKSGLDAFKKLFSSMSSYRA